VVSGGKAVFRKVTTGITGATDIEVLDGSRMGRDHHGPTSDPDIRNEAQVKVDNKTPAQQKT